MPVPLRIVYDDGSESMIRLNVKGREVTGELPTPKAAVRLELNPLQSVLAEVKEEKWKEAPESR